MAGSEVSVEVKLSLADKQAAKNLLPTRGSPRADVHLNLEKNLRGGEETTLAESKLPFVMVRGGTLVTVQPLISNSSLVTVNSPAHS